MSYYQCKYDDCDKIFLHKDSYVKHFKKKHGDNVTYNTLSDHHRKIYVNSFYIRTYKCPETIRINIKNLISTKSSLTDEEFKNEVNNAIENNLILQQPNEHINDDEVHVVLLALFQLFLFLLIVVQYLLQKNQKMIIQCL